MDEIRLPQTYLDMPRWWSGGAQWLAALPQAVAAQCRRWELTVAGELSHGSHAVAVPVVRGGEDFVLRMAQPEPDLVAQVAALRFWAGRGTVLLHDADVDSGAMLLERLAMDQPLSAVPVDEAVATLGRMMRRLAVPAPPDAPSTADRVRVRAAELEPAWHRLNEPFDAAFLTEAVNVAQRLSVTRSQLAVNADLHGDQVLRGVREPWLAVDPVLLRGDIDYDLARVLWTRIDDMPDAGIPQHFEIAVREAGLDRDRARDWVLFRTVDYWLWGLGVGLTEDPQRCRRLLRAVLE